MAVALAGMTGLLIGAVLGLSRGRARVPAVVDDGGRAREIQATTARRLADARAERLQGQVDRLRAACLLPAAVDGVTPELPLPQRHSDAAARLVRLMGGVRAAVVAGPDGLSLSSRESVFERSLAATVPAVAPLVALTPFLGATSEVVVVLRSGLGVRLRMLGDGEALVVASDSGVPSALLTRAAVAELGFAPPAKVAAPPAPAHVDIGASTRIKELAARAGFRSLALFSGDSVEVALSTAGLSLVGLRAMRAPLQQCIVQLQSALGSPVTRLEILGEQRLSLVAGEFGWWLAQHPSLTLDDMAVRRLEGAQRVSLTTKVA